MSNDVNVEANEILYLVNESYQCAIMSNQKIILLMKT